MKVDVFEGFKRFNKVVIVLIFIFGFVISFNQNAYVDIDKTIVFDGKRNPAEQYAEWIIANKGKKGTPEFETVAEKYKSVRHRYLNDGEACQTATSTKRHITKYGTGYIAICLPTSGSYDELKSIVDGLNLTKYEKSNFDKQIFAGWLWSFFKGLGITALFILGYIALCTGVNYIAKGFLKNEG